MAAGLNTLRLWTEDENVQWSQEGTSLIDIVLADVDDCGTPEIIVASSCSYDDDGNPDTPDVD